MSSPDTEGFDAWYERVCREEREGVAAILAAASAARVLRVRDKHKGEHYIHPCARGDGGPWQVTRFDQWGPSGHWCASTFEAALRELWKNEGALTLLEVA